ncbi:unnamed protein product [Adineta ricciae]|uniref:Uncharacterized protein n=1 Tax=Adineta ricciae TaxID=249248 RepID=A0A813QM17_ADIRI|nr:unnamed protein product [Adineta ricciae]
MYCIQWLLPLILLPHPILPSIHHYLFLVLHLLNFVIEKRPLYILAVMFTLVTSTTTYKYPRAIFYSNNQEC